MAKEPLVPQPESGQRKCPNCLAVATHAFCPQCGQATHGFRASFRDLIADFFNVWFGAESRSWRSLWLLFRKPGALCLEYQKGRRQRYVPPLRLYLFMSVLLLLVAKCQGDLHNDSIFSVGSATSADVPDLDAEMVGELEQKIRDSFLSDDSWWQKPVRDFLIERTHRMDRMSDSQRNATLSREMVANIPFALLALLPFFAFYLRIMWFRSGWIYFDHFIFTLQFQSFLFALLTLVILISSPGWLYGTVLFFYPPIYLTLAQRRVTQRSYWRCILNTILLGPLLTFTSVGIVICLAAFSFLTF
ncbi:MAG: DUF3667 domain-containing protein [Planctomycetota bacterium]|nr:DUF3667 domain-containing protein [Planctomycetota bacterium]MDA1113459.1 DUF3667 domain-containing protein [Planctomycetota bacterium]